MDKKPFLTEAQAQQILQDVPTPFHIYDEKGIRENARRINTLDRVLNTLRSRPCPTPISCRSCGRRAAGVDCSSFTELMLSEAVGFAGEEIMFSSNQTPSEDMKKAAPAGGLHQPGTTPPWWTSWTAWPACPRRCSAATIPAAPSAWGESEEGFQVMDRPRRGQVRHDRGADGGQLPPSEGQGCPDVRHPPRSWLPTPSRMSIIPSLAAILFRLAVRLSKAADVHIKYINLSGGVGHPLPSRPA